MGEHHRVERSAWLAGFAALLVALPWVSGCDRRSGEAAPGPPAPATMRTAPVDHLRPGEIAEGTESAFGLPIPRDMRIRERYAESVYAVGRVGFEPLANYVRERVEAKRVDTGPAKTVFVGAVLKSDPGRRVHVEVRRGGGLVELVVRDETPKPVDPGLSEEEKWKRAGVRPDGGLVPELAE